MTLISAQLECTAGRSPVLQQVGIPLHRPRLEKHHQRAAAKRKVAALAGWREASTEGHTGEEPGR